MFQSDDYKIKDLQNRLALFDDEKAFNELFLILSEDIYRYSYKIIKSHESAEEVVSDVFIKLWAIRKKLPEIKHLKFYLIKTTKNYCLNFLAKRAMVTDDLSSCRNIGSRYDPEQMCITKESIINIERAVQELPKKCRNIFLMVKVEGLPYKEVSSRLNISTFTVRNQMTIATKKIHERLNYQPK